MYLIPKTGRFLYSCILLAQIITPLIQFWLPLDYQGTFFLLTARRKSVVKNIVFNHIVPSGILLALLLLPLLSSFLYLTASLILPIVWFLIYLRQRFPVPTWPVHYISFWQWQSKLEADAFHCFSSVDHQSLWIFTDCPSSSSPLLWCQSWQYLGFQYCAFYPGLVSPCFPAPNQNAFSFTARPLEFFCGFLHLCYNKCLLYSNTGAIQVTNNWNRGLILNSDRDGLVSVNGQRDNYVVIVPL